MGVVGGGGQKGVHTTGTTCGDCCGLFPLVARDSSIGVLDMGASDRGCGRHVEICFHPPAAASKWEGRSEGGEKKESQRERRTKEEKGKKEKEKKTR